MAFCGNCGRQLEDGEVCTCTQNNQQFGAQQPGNQQFGAQQFGNQQSGNQQFAGQQFGNQAGNVAGEFQSPQTVNKKNKTVFYALAAVVVAVVLYAAFNLIGGGYMSPVNDVMALINKKSTDANKYRVAMMSSDLAKPVEKIASIAIKADKDAFEDENEVFEDFYEDLDDEWKKWKLSFDMKSKKKLDKDDLKDLQELYADNYDDYYEDVVDRLKDALEDDDDLEDLADSMDISEKDAKAVVKELINFFGKFKKLKVTEGYKVKGKFVIKADGEEYKTDTKEFYVYKINGDWCYGGGASGDYFRFDLDGEDVSVSQIENILNTNYISYMISEFRFY